MNLPIHLPSIATLSADLYGWAAQSGHQPVLPELEATLSPDTHCILMVIDGLGANMLALHGEHIFSTYQVRTLRSLFPSSTVPCISTFLTGVSPADHGFYGWETYHRSTDTRPVITFLGQYRGSRTPLSSSDLEDFYRVPHRRSQAQVPLTIAQPADTIGSRYTQILTSGARSLPIPVSYDPQVLDPVFDELFASEGPGFSYVYWPCLDHLSHDYGWTSPQASAQFFALCDFMEGLLPRIPAHVSLVVTADHGHITVTPEDHLWVQDLPGFGEFLAKPLSGEPRMPIVHLRPEMQDAFAGFVHTHYAHLMEYLPVSEVLRLGIMGTSVSPTLTHRLGDGLLLMKGHYMLKDILPEETPHYFHGMHGGLTEDELSVPLCLFTRSS